MLRSALERIQPRVVSYEEQATAIREQLAKLLEDEEEWTKAAQTLAGIDLDSGEPPTRQLRYQALLNRCALLCQEQLSIDDLASSSAYSNETAVS